MSYRYNSWLNLRRHLESWGMLILKTSFVGLGPTLILRVNQMIANDLALHTTMVVVVVVVVNFLG